MVLVGLRSVLVGLRSVLVGSDRFLVGVWSVLGNWFWLFFGWLLFARLPFDPPANPRSHAKFQEKNIKIELPQYWDYASRTQCKKCCTNHGLTSRRVSGKYVLWLIYFTIRILVPMPILTFVNWRRL